MTRVALFTSFTFSYLSRAMVLLRTVKNVHPDWEFWALMVDKCPPGANVDPHLAEFDHVIYSEELGLDRHQAWLFKHDIVEACTAVKAQMLRHLLRQGYEKVIYLDPDIAVFQSMESIVNLLDCHSIVLTPHQAEPNSDYGVSRDNELTSMRFGVYNLGFVAVRDDPAGRGFADWWSQHLYNACYADIENGIFTDQKYCDLVPGLFDGVYIERDPGCNLASWNLSRRKVSFTREGGILVNGSPLKFYHFTKINSEGDLMTERYAGENTEVIEVWRWYKKAIGEIVVEGLPNKYWHYNHFTNGAAIPKKARILFRQRDDLYRHFEDPFDSEGDGSFYQWLLREQPDLLTTQR